MKIFTEIAENQQIYNGFRSASADRASASARLLYLGLEAFEFKLFAK